MSKPITPDHIFDIPSISQPHLSSDGSTLAFVKTSIDRSTMERHSHVVVSQHPFDELSALTDGSSDTAPVIDGERVLFLRPDDGGNKQVCSIPLDGGEPQRFTDLVGGVEEFALSPNGDRIAAVSSVDPNMPDDPDSGLPRVRVVRRVRYRHDYHGFTGDAFRQMFLVDAVSRDARQITNGEGDNWSPVWSPDGTSLAFISDDIEGRDFTTNTQVKVVSVPDGEPVSWSEALPYVWAVAWSPDGQSLAAIGCHDPEMWDPRSAWLYVLDSSGSVSRITDGLYTPVPECGLSWTAEHGITFVGAHRGEYFVCNIRPDGSEFKTITDGGVNSESATFDGSASHAVIVAESPQSPAELVHVDLEMGVQRAVTTYTSKYISSHPPARMEKFTITRGEFEIESRVLLPPDFTYTKKYPMVLDIHGGPHGRLLRQRSTPCSRCWPPTATSCWRSTLAAPQPTGPKFMAKAVMGDWGGEDYLDIMAAVDEVSARPYVDAARMGVHGIQLRRIHDQLDQSATTTGSRAAVVGAPCIDLPSMYGTSDIGVQLRRGPTGAARRDRSARPLPGALAA